MSIEKKQVETSRLKVSYLETNQNAEKVVIFIHGNASSAVYWKEAMQNLPEEYRGIAPDLRGYGETEDKIIDATQGMNDWVEDFQAFIKALNIEKYHVIGHSLGGAFIFSLLAKHSNQAISATLVCPGSPYGFGGTKDAIGTPCFPDFAGSGGGIVNPEFAKLMGEKNRNSDNPQASPRVVMNSFYWKPPFIPKNEEELLDGLLSQRVGDTKYPGDFESSTNYPFVAPGKYGPLNALSPKYIGNTVTDFINMSHKTPILWVRGSDDQIISDNSLFDFGTLGKMGAIPNYPGEETFPPQPMVSQTRHVLSSYKENGGEYIEFEIPDTAHTPFIEKPEVFNEKFHTFLKSNNT